MQVLSDQNVAPTLSRRLDERRKLIKINLITKKKSESNQKCSLLIITNPITDIHCTKLKNSHFHNQA